MKLVFVSSTFKDMQAERDALHEYVEPVIDGELAPYGETVYFGDLRWGVNTTALDSEEGSRRVLEVCLDEIDDCKPYMIVLIGERYGWIPEAQLIRSAAEMKGIEVDDGISVTQFEIEYGALLSPESKGRVLFYFRELDKTGMTEDELADFTAESDLHREKIEALKERIRELYPDAIRHYCASWDPETHSVRNLDGFLDTVRCDLSRVFLSDIAEDESIPWQQRAINSAHRYFMEKSAHYCPVERRPITLFDGTFTADETRMHFIKGAAGTGKTAYLAHTYREEYAECRDGMLPFVLGLDKYSTCEMDYFKILLYEVERLSDTPHYETVYGDPAFDKEVFKRIFCYAGITEVPIHSYIDNCSFELQNLLSSKLLDTHIPMADFEYFNRRENPYKTLDFHVAYSAEEPTVILPPWFDYARTYVLDDISTEEITPFINTLLRSKHKELAEEVVAAITEKESAAMPMYLKLVVDRLLMLDSADFASIRGMGDGMDNINRYQLSVIESLPEDTEGMAGELIRKVAERVDEKLVYRTLALLIYSSVRLTEAEISAIFSGAGWDYSSLDFSLATRSLGALIGYNPKDKSYYVTNRDVISAATEVLEAEGYAYVSRALYDYIVTLPRGHRLYDALFRVASYVSPDFLAEFYGKQSGVVEALAGETVWLIGRRGAEFAAQILTRVACEHPECDFSYILERVPTSCLTEEDYNPYCTLLQTILDNLLPLSPAPEHANRNTLAAVAWWKLVSIRMLVNTSDAAPLFHDFIDAGYRDYPLTDRARVQLEIIYFRFIAREAYYSMNYPNAEYDEPTTAHLVDEANFPRDGETLLYMAHLYGAFAIYCERYMAFHIDYKEYRAYANKAYRAILQMQISRGDAATFSADDIATMIDTSLENKGEYASIDYESICAALELMACGYAHVDSRLNKYLPRILAEARFSYDDEGTPVYHYLRLCAVARAVAGGAMTLDDCVYAAIQMGYAADILIECDLGREYFVLLRHLDRFIRISISFSKGDARTLYRLYTPIRNLMTSLDICDATDAVVDIAEFIEGAGITDEEAPLLPELFIGSLIYAFVDKENEELLYRLREIRDTVNEEEAYAPYLTAYSPELMYVGIDIRTPEEIAEDNNYFTYSDGDEYSDDGDSYDEDGDFDSDWEGDDGDDEPIDIEGMMARLSEMGIDPAMLFPTDFDISSMMGEDSEDDGEE